MHASTVRLLCLLTCIAFSSLVVQAGRNGPSPLEQDPLVETGFNPNLFRLARDRTAVAFTEQEYDLFVGMMTAMVELETSPPNEPAQQFDLVEALRSPTKYRGTFSNLFGTVRRITPVQITSGSLRKKLNLERYFQIDFFVSTNKTNFNLQDDQGQIVISGTYGLTLIMAELPPFLKPGQTAINVNMPGVFVKNWAHKTVATRKASSNLRRPSPIVFGISAMARQKQPQPADLGPGTLIAWCLGGLLLMIMVLGVWQFRISAKRKRDLADSLPEKIDL